MTTPRIDLFWLGNNQPPVSWPVGETICADLTIRGLVEACRARLPQSNADAWLLWDAALGQPNLDIIQNVYALPGNLWHAGLKMAMTGKPGLLDFLKPTWMLNRDPPAHIEATSWRLSLRACLIQTDVLRQMGLPSAEFESLDGASLEYGYRCITQGVITRHIPALVDNLTAKSDLTLADEFRFIRAHFSRQWRWWALQRAVMTGYAPPLSLLSAWRKSETVSTTHSPVYQHPESEALSAASKARVSVLIPTLDRYAYLRALLPMLRQQTIPPLEIIIVDQTEAAQRDTRLEADFPDLPIKLITLDEAGQCVSRNAGLKEANGDYILFIDDDDEIQVDLIEQHLALLEKFRTPVSNGTAYETGTAEYPSSFTITRVSDVFPTNNTLIEKSVLHGSGLFDLAYNRMARADGDLGMRVYLSGALMMYSPDISLIHHHAPRGGLRAHKARVITYSSSRHNLRHRQIISPSEIYLNRRYFTDRQVREAMTLSALGTFSIRGNAVRRLAKVGLGLIYLPNTLWRIRKNSRQADDMLKTYPQIPELN
jgi:glycosyltransferase involved in cell wall biosynthesis